MSKAVSTLRRKRHSLSNMGVADLVAHGVMHAGKKVFKAIGKRLHGSKLTHMPEPEKLHRLKGQDINKFERKAFAARLKLQKMRDKKKK